MTSASIYVRLSKEAGDSNTSLEGMLDDCRTLAERHGLTVVAEHVDNGLTGSLRDRPEFMAWVADGREGRASVLISPVTDRLTREGVNAAALVLDVHEGKDDTGRVVRPPVRILTADGLDSERDAEAFRWRFVIAAEVARGERQRIVARAKAGRRNLNAAGRYPGGSTPFGYTAVPAADGKGYRLAVDPEQAALVRSIMGRLMAGETITSVVSEFNRDGVPSPADQQRIKAGKPARGASWRVSNLARLLRSPSLLGQATTRLGTGYAVLRGEDGMPVQRAEPILTDEEMADLTRVLSSRGPVETTRRKPQPFLGVARCECGAQLYEIRNAKGYAYYRCGKYQQTRTHDGPRPRSVRVEVMIESCLRGLWVLLWDVPRMRREFAPGSDSSAELHSVTRAIDELMDDRALGLYSSPEATAKFRRMVAGLEERKAKLEAAGSTPDRWEYVPTGEMWQEWLKRNRDDWPALGEVLRQSGIWFELHAEPQTFTDTVTGRRETGPRWTVEVPPGFLGARGELTAPLVLPNKDEEVDTRGN